MNLTIVRVPMEGAGGEAAVPLRVDRHTLAKRRWRGVAEDGREFGFDLEEPLRDGIFIHREDAVSWVIAQNAEAVLEIALPRAQPEEAARRGWMLGNLHFPIEIGKGVIRVADDSAVRDALNRADVNFEEASRVFRPMQTHAHGH